MLLDYVTADDERVGDLLAADAETYGEPSLFARAVANNPDVLAARMEYVDALRDAGSVDDRLAELAYATVALANDCDYCVASHTTQLVEHVGVEDHEVEMLVDAVRDTDDLERSARLVESFDERERAVIAFAHAAAANPKRVSSDDVERLHAVGFDDAAIAQLLALVSAAVAANTVADTLNILPADRPDESTG
jgi:uncharacterized peroxidase-related enzyme